VTTDPLFGEMVALLERSWVPQPDKPEETPELTIAALWSTAAGAPCSVIAAAERPLERLDFDGAKRLRALVERRASGVPLAHLTGRQRFLDLEMLAGPEALIPRRETELLARVAIDLAAQAGDAPLVMDLCTGAGNIALAIASRVPAMAMGRIGTCASTASENAPPLNWSSSSLGERVPSGKIITETRLPSRSRHWVSASAPLSRSPRTTGTSPAMRIIQPITGMLKMVFFESHFISHGR